MTYGPPEYPRATSSPTIILLASGLTGVLGFLIGFFAGLGSSEPPRASPYAAPRMTVTMEDPTPPAEQPTAPATGTPLGGVPTPEGTATGAPTGSPEADTAAQPSGGNRTLVVGVDIQPGSYKTTGPALGQPMCYWARLKDTVGGVITAGMPKGPETVTIEPTDKAFQTGGCAEWVKVTP